MSSGKFQQVLKPDLTSTTSDYNRRLRHSIFIIIFLMNLDPVQDVQLLNLCCFGFTVESP